MSGPALGAQVGREPSGPVLLGVALVWLCVLMLQLTLTRLFSATIYYAAISLARFGSAACQKREPGI